MNLKLKSLGVALLYCVLFKLSFGFGNFIKDGLPLEYYWYGLGAYGTISILLITWVFLRLEKKTFKSIGLNWEKQTPVRFGTGFLLGVGISVAMLSTLLIFADLKIEWGDNVEIPAFLYWSLAFIPTAFMEEVAFRSYPFLKLNKVFGLRITQLIIAVLFALYHVGEGPIMNVFLGPGVWVLIYGVAAVYSNGIALPTGLHFGANFILAAIGDKKGLNPILIIEYVRDATPEMIAHTEMVGIIVQMLLLAAGLIATERYLRKTTTISSPGSF